MVSAYGGLSLAHSIADRLRPMLIGKDPAYREAIWQDMWRKDRLLSTTQVAIGTVDFALWDADQKETLTDHTIYDPCKASAVGSLQALENWAAREKQRKYDDVVTELQQRDHRITFVPMVFSALGRFAPAALDILRLKPVRANPDKVRRWPTGQAGLINATINAVSCAIQRGNVQMLLMAANEVHRILRGDARRAGEPAV